MAYKTQLSGYVKFLRGTPAAWASIETKNSDTLYFIAEPNATSGQLYLGNKLISGGGSGSAVTINDLQDVLIGSNIPSDAVLVYNDTDEMWEPVSLETAVASIVGPMRGATAEADGLAGLVPQPLAGQQGLFLRGDGTWVNPTAAVEASLAGLRGSDTTGTIREIAVNAINDLLSDAPENLDTLQELADWIADHEDELNLAGDIENLSNAMFGTVENPTESIAELVEMVQEDGVIRILSNLQTTIFGDEQDATGLEDRVSALEDSATAMARDISDLNDLMTAADGRLDTIESKLDDIDDKLRWSDLVEDNENNG